MTEDSFIVKDDKYDELEALSESDKHVYLTQNSDDLSRINALVSDAIYHIQDDIALGELYGEDYKGLHHGLNILELIQDFTTLKSSKITRDLFIERKKANDA